MAETIDYSQRPYSYFVITAAQDNLFSRPLVSTARIQFIPWDKPQHEKHEKSIDENRTTYSNVQITDPFHDPDLGVIQNRINYFNPDAILPTFVASQKRPSAASVRATYNIQGIVDVRWLKPTNLEMRAYSRKAHGVSFRERSTFYTLKHHAEVEDLILSVHTINLVGRNDLVGKNVLHEPLQHTGLARDPDFGIVVVRPSYTSSEEIYGSWRDCHSNLGDQAKIDAWNNLSENAGGPTLIGLFEGRPQRGELETITREFLQQKGVGLH